MNDTIFALASGSLGCGVAVVRVSGPKAALIAEKFCGAQIAPRQAIYSSIRDPRDRTLIDHGLILYFAGPASFTGENCLEFQVHGSRAVVARLFQALAAEDACRIAEPGEFIRRSFEPFRNRFAVFGLDEPREEDGLIVTVASHSRLPQRVERAAEAHGNGLCAVPGQVDDGPLGAQDVQRTLQPSG